MTLVEFLRARLAEDDAAARAFGIGVWSVAGPQAEHIARWDPARVLAECEAKRRIIEQVRDVKWGGFAVRDTILELLALPYADHPDYRAWWAP